MSDKSGAGTANDGADKTTTGDASKAESDKAGADQGGKETTLGDAQKGDLKTDDLSGLKKALQATRKERDDLLKAQRDSELAKLPELERAQAEAHELKTQNEKLILENMRMKISMDLGLPWSLAKRLSGETEEEMRADGAELLKSFKVEDNKILKDDKDNKKKTTNDGPAKGASGKPDLNTLLRIAAGRRV